MRRTDRPPRRAPARARPPASARPQRPHVGPTAALLVLLAGALGVWPGCDPVEETPPADAPRVIVPAPPADVPLRVLLTGSPVEQARLGTTGPCRVEADGRLLFRTGAAPATLAVRREAAGWRLAGRLAPGRELMLLPDPGAHVRLGSRSYRGLLRLLPAEPAGRFVVINEVDVEAYLPGVLAKELYPGWHVETYRALAVAARTFALYQKITVGPGREYDLGDDQASQVYGGIDAETSRSRRAVAETRGVVLAFGPPGAEKIFLAQYSACCGGRVNGADVIRSASRIPPLAGGQVCNHCARCPRYRWPAVRIAKRDIYRALAARYPAAAALGGVRQVRVRTATDWGRAVWTDVVGPGGRSIRVRAEDIRLALLMAGVPAARRLYSMNCRMIDRGDTIEFADGRGFGHGVGLCQWGAEGLAVEGRSAEQILAFYYPGATLLRAY